MAFQTNTMKYNVGDRVKYSDDWMSYGEGVIMGYIHWPTMGDYLEGKPCNYHVLLDNGRVEEVFEETIKEVLNGTT